MKHKIMLSLLAPLALSMPALAQYREPPKRISTELAQEASEAAIAHCEAQGLTVGAGVVDAAGNPIFLTVPEGARFFVGDFVMRKGLTMSITGQNASATQGLIDNDPAMKEKVEANARWIHYGGGVVLKRGGEMVGALAVSGATAEQDEVCAQAGLDKIAGRF